MAVFQIIVTAGFSRSLKKLALKHPKIIDVYEKALDVLNVDPANVTRQHDIKKLTGVPAGDGQWRIRIGKYRLRYDIEALTVVLRAINDRKDAYR
jgi:addiction module RelE/StbE family toxin